jgi:hypothetical protein
LGILLIIACGGYLVDAVVQVLFPNIDGMISQFTFVGELLLPLWLVFKGVNVEQWQRDALTNGAREADGSFGDRRCSVSNVCCGRGCGVTRACCQRGRAGARHDGPQLMRMSLAIVLADKRH